MWVSQIRFGVKEGGYDRGHHRYTGQFDKEYVGYNCAGICCDKNKRLFRDNEEGAADGQAADFLILIFGIFSIFGTLSGIEINTAIANIRDLGPAIAGLVGGPVVGLGAGLIGGVHRYLLGGITQIGCSLSTVIAGLAGGLIYHYRKDEFVNIKTSVIFMVLMEAFHMGLNLLIGRPFDQVLNIVESVSLPMIFTNGLGMGIFAFMVQNLIRERDAEAKRAYGE